jgi:prolipoprotein diacylglyceryltransferase
MSFPVYFHIFGLRLHPHLVMELVAYGAGFQLYRYLQSRFPRTQTSVEQNLWILVGVVFGALVGSKVLALLESFPEYWPHRFQPEAVLQGKTIVGGLLGGWAGVEIAKRPLGIRHSTGDVFVFPLILGQCLGRIGCFLTGLDDHTHGNFTRLPWAVNFGDGPRHPTQLYEIAYLLLLGVVLWIFYRTSYNSGLSTTHTFFPSPGVPKEGANAPPSEISRAALNPLPNGALFRLYLLGYLLFRFFIEFVKPTWKPYAGLSAIQLSAILGSIVCVISLMRLKSQQLSETTDEQPLPARSES